MNLRVEFTIQIHGESQIFVFRDVQLKFRKLWILKLWDLYDLFLDSNTYN